MKIFYTNSPRGRSEYGVFYDAAVKKIQSLGVEVVSLEIQKYADLLGDKYVKEHSKEESHYSYICKGIDQANAVIIDASMDSFTLGHESTLSMLYNKPFICISKNWDYSINIRHPKFNAAMYKDVEDLERIIESFFEVVKNKHLSVRFNGYLSPQQKNFLDWYADQSNKNVSEIVRDLIDQKIESTPHYLKK